MNSRGFIGGKRFEYDCGDSPSGGSKNAISTIVQILSGTFGLAVPSIPETNTVNPGVCFEGPEILPLNYWLTCDNDKSIILGSG